MTGFSAAQRQRILEALERGAPLVCPVCAGEIRKSDAPPPPGVAYVRKRFWVRCSGCQRATLLDAEKRHRPT